MSYPKKMLRLKPRRGVASDLPAWSTGPEFFSQADNVVFRLGVAERAPSTVAVYDPPSVAPYILQNLQIGAANYWIYQGATASYVVEGSTHTDITHASGLNSQTDVSKLSMGSLNGVPFFNNALDEPMYWDGDLGNNYVDLPGWTSTESCNFMVAHRYHLFAFGIDGPAGAFANQIKWSSAAAPGSVPASWTASASNEAGDNILSDSPGALVSAANLRNVLMIYKMGSTYAAEYVGGQNIFAFRSVFSQAGALARHSVADISGRHLIVTDGDIVVTDGSNIQSIAQNRRKRFLFNQLDQNNFQHLFVAYNRAKNEAWICFPEAGNSLCTRAMIYDIANDAWGDRELPGICFAAPGIISDTSVDETWDADAAAWDTDLTVWNEQSFSAVEVSLVLADCETPDFLQVGSGSESLTTTLAKYAIDFDAPERFKFVRRVHLRIEGDTSIEFMVRVGTQATTEDTITWGDSQSISSNSGYANVLAFGRFISVEITATTDKTFKITGVDLEADLRGYH